MFAKLMFEKHILFKSNHANAYRVFSQTSLCPADYLKSREQRICMVQNDAGMIQTRPIIANRDWQAGLDKNLGWQLGRFSLANSVESRKRRWRQKPGELTELEQLSR